MSTGAQTEIPARDIPRGRTSPSGRTVLWILLILFAIEFYAFDQIGAHPHTKIYPRWFDQIQYLTEAYTGHEYAKTHGFASGLLHSLTNPSAQGTLHDVYSVIAFQLLGPSRSAALALNIIALIAWQASLFWTARRLLRSDWIALLLAMLPAALFGPWRSIPGSAFDFRLDHLAMCAMGVAVTLAVPTDGFRHRRNSLIFGVAVGVTLLTRFLTGTYLVLILLLLLGWIACGAERGRRMGNLLLAAAIAFALAAPVYWINRDWIWNYYWIGHYTGPESAIRNPNFGLLQSTNFVVRHLYQEHLGAFFCGLVGAFTVVLALFRRAGRCADRPGPWAVGLITVLAPALILILHVQKSPVVLGVMAPGVLVMVLALWHTLTVKGPAPARMPLLAGAAALGCLGYFLSAQARPAFDPETGAALRRVTQFGEMIAQRARDRGLTNPRVAVDQVTDALDGQILRVTTYERTGKWVPFEMMLPTGIAEPTEEEVMDRLKLSDFVFVTTAAPQSNYPYDRKLAALSPKVLAWCAAELVEVERFSLYGSQFTLYERPFPPTVTAGGP